MTSKWADLFRPIPAAGGGGGGGVGGGVDALLGTVVTGLSIPIIAASGTVAGVFTGAATISACASDPNAYDVSFTDGGTAHTIALAKSGVQAHAAKAAACSPIDINAAACSPLVETLLRALPASSALPSGKVCALEALEVFKAAGISTAITDPTHAAFAAMFLAYSVRLATMLASPSAAARTWPNLSPARLGGEIAAFYTRGAPAATAAASAASTAPHARFPRAEALLGLASSASERDSFLTKSVDVTVDAGKPDHAAQAKASEFIRSGALDAYLGKCGDAGTVASLSARAGALDSEELLALVMFTITPEQSSASSSTATSLARGGINVNVTQPDLSGSDDDRRMRLQLRNDASGVASDAAAMVELGKLSSLTAPASSTALHLKVRDLTHEGLKRVVGTSQDIEKALTGMPASLSHTGAAAPPRLRQPPRYEPCPRLPCGRHTRPCPRYTCHSSSCAQAMPHWQVIITCPSRDSPARRAEPCLAATRGHALAALAIHHHVLEPCLAALASDHHVPEP